MRQLEITKLGTTRTFTRRVRQLMLVATVAGMGGKSAAAASTWTGPAGTASTPTTGFWNAAGNWSPSGVPASSTTTELDFLGTSSYISTDDITGAFNLNILKINGSGGTIAASGTNSLAFNGSAPIIQQIGAGTFTIAAPVNLTKATTVSQVNAAEIDFTGTVLGTGGLTLNNVSGVPTNSIVSFSGANSFTGLTVNAHVTARSALSSSSTTLGSGSVTLAGGVLQLQGRQTAAGGTVEQAIGVTGFSGTTIRDAASGSSATSSNGTPLDVIDGGNLLFVNGYQGNQNGLPSNGIINSPLASNAIFKLGYNGSAIDLVDKNTLYFTNTTAQSLTLTAATKATSLQFLAQSQKATTMDVKITFSDNSVSAYNGAISTGDWAFTSNQSNTVYSATDALNRGGNIAANFNAKLYESDLTLTTADAAKTISSIQFIPTSLAGGVSAEIYAVSGLVTGSSAVLLDSQAYSNAVNVTASSSIDISKSLTATMGALTINGSRLSVTSSDATASAYSLTMGAVTLTGNSSFDVAASTGGGAGTLTLGALNDSGAARTITINPAGSGSVSLNANAASLGAGTAINISNGTLNSNTGSSVGSTSTITLFSPGNFVLGASQTISALNGSGGTVQLAGNNLTVGSTDNLNSTYSGAIAGGGILVKAGTGSLTLAGTSSTFGGTSVNSNGAQINSSVVLNSGTVIAAGASNLSTGTISSGPLGKYAVIANAGTSLLLDNTPGRVLANSVYASSSGSTATTLGGLNTTGVTSFTGNITLGTGSSGDNSHNIIVGATAGGEVDFTGRILANSTTNLSKVSVVNLTGSGSSVVRFTGSNTYNGGTTINPNATLAVGPSTSTTTLGTGNVTLAGGKLSLGGVLPSGSQQIVTVSGYSDNTIVDAAAADGSNTSTGTPTSFIGNGLVFFENGYQGNTTNGLPVGGLVNSALTGHSFQLAPYTGKNTLRFTSPGSQDFTLASPAKFQTLNFLATSQSTANFSVTLTFSDSTTDTVGGFTTADWYGGSAASNAVTGLNPAQQDANGSPSSTIFNFGGALTIGEYDLTVPLADQAKTVTGITMNATAVNGNSADIYAVSGATAVGNIPLMSQTYANNLTVTADSGIDVSGSLNASIGTLSIGGQTLTITSADTTNSPYSLTTGTVSFAAQHPTFDVRNSVGGGMGSLILGSIDDGGAAQTLTKLGAGSLVLNSPATMISSPSTYNIAAGTLASNNTMAMSFDTGSGVNYVAVKVSSVATFSIGADQAVTSINDYDAAPTLNGGKIVLNAHTLTIGSIQDADSTFSGIISDGTASGGGIVKAGAGTLTLKGASTYSGPTYVAFGTLLVKNTTGSATGTGDVTLANTSNAMLTSGPVGSISGNLIAGQLSSIYPGGNGSIGSLTLGGLTTGYNTKIGFDLGTGSGIITNGDLLTLGGGTVSIAPDTLLLLSSSPTAAAKYRLIGGAISGVDLTSIILPTAPTGVSYTLSTSVDAGYIDLVVGSASTGANNLVWNNSLSTTGDGISWANTTGSPDSAQNWINTSTSTASGFTSGDIVTFSDANNGKYNVNLTSNVLPASVTVSAAGTYNISSSGGFAIGDVPSGITTLTQTGGGLLNISNVNTFTGATNISGGGTTLHLTSTGKIKSTSLTVGTGAIANIDGTLTNVPAITVNGTLNIGPTDINNDPTASILIRSWGSLTIGSGAKLVIKPATSTALRTVLVATSLSNSGKIDVSNNDMVLRSTTTGTIETQLASGFNNGLWNGAVGIVSSNASGSSLRAVGFAPGGAIFDGVTTTASDVLLKYTYFGDADLNGKVDASDYSRIDSAYAIGNQTGWNNGDFNYDNVINGSDYTLIDNAFNRQGAQLTTEFASPLAVATAQIAGGTSSAVPEPTTLSLLTIGAAGLLRRRATHTRRPAHYPAH